MRIQKIYISDDGRQFQTREQAINHEKSVRYEANQRERRMRREDRLREKERVRSIKRQEKENVLRNKLTSAFGETINPAINIIIQHKSMIRQILTGRRSNIIRGRS